MLPTFFFSDGVATPYISGANGSVEATSADGTLISRGSFATSFELVTDTGNIIPTDTSVFLVQLTSSSEVDSVQIKKDGVILGSFNPTAKLLEDVIKNIPDSSFAQMPARKRAELLGLSNIIEKHLRVCGSFKDARRSTYAQEECKSEVVDEVLRLRAKVDTLLNDSNQKTRPTDMTKGDVLKTIDTVALFTIPNRTVKVGSHPISIRFIPRIDFDRKSDPIFSITDVSQGEHGNVNINSDGTVTYRPTQNVAEDHFEVLMKNSDGVSSTKKVRVLTLKKENEHNPFHERKK